MEVLRNNPTLDRASLPQALHHQSPAAVLDDPDLQAHEKRAILSSWASDFYAVKSCPSLREIPGLKGTLRLEDILRRCDALDDEPPPRGGVSARVVHLKRTERLRTGPSRIEPGEAVAA